MLSSTSQYTGGLKRLIGATAVALIAASTSASALVVNINPVANGGLDIGGGGAVANAQQVLDAFDRAADQWEALFTDNVTIEIDADFRNFGAGNGNIIGQAQSTLLTGGFDLVRGAMVADAAAEADDSIVGFLPTAAQFSAFIPNGIGIAPSISLTQANALALGFGRVTPSDALIEFNSTFNFDLDNSDGVTGTDFETVALHEIGHALGFVSVVDDIDFIIDQQLTNQNITVRPLDLFRFGDPDDLTGTQNPFDTTSFTNFARNLVPGLPTFFDDLDNEYGFSTGVSQGDGRQASHWLDDALSGDLIGLLDPTLGNGFVSPITVADIRAFDLIGWDFEQLAANVPEPGVTLLLIVGLLMAHTLRRRPAMAHPAG